ncbi:swi5-dependent recombination DNA repair protein 1 homolog [Sardina pilchardus]|uniref:swi5-dependent recombination DNA repair protein 1 homolog n=1 Tax=Sardina pilchardus TaxID=27697 RepID=UPI002E0E60BB
MDTTPKAQKSLSVLYTPNNDVDANVSPPSSKIRTMSSSLRQRLKRSRRSFTSPLAVAKRLNVDEGDDMPIKPTEEEERDDFPASPTIDGTIQLKMVKEHTEMDLNHNEKKLCERPVKQTLEMHADSAQFPQTDILQLRDALRREVKEKAETLRRLQMVKMYRKKNDLSRLRTLSMKWRQCAQGVLYELQTALPADGHKASLGQLMDQFGLEDRLLHYDRTEDDFREV